MRRTACRLRAVATLMILMLALVLAVSACGGGDRGAQTKQEEESAKRQEEPGQGEQPSQREQPTQQHAQEESAQRETAIIEITGNTAYYCTVGRIDSSRTVEGRAPATYKLKVVPGGTSLDTVMAVCQKTAAGGPLGVRILYGGEVKAQKQTTARLGTVAVSWSPVEG